MPSSSLTRRGPRRCNLNNQTFMHWRPSPNPTGSEKTVKCPRIPGQRQPTRLHPSHHNHRSNDESDELATASIPEFGFRQSDLRRSRERNHRRLHAMQSSPEVGLDKVPVYVAQRLTSEQINACRIADNNSSETTQMWSPWYVSFLRTTSDGSNDRLQVPPVCSS